MRGRAYIIALAAAGLVASQFVLASVLPSAYAGDTTFCVTCKGPDQTYLCRITGEAAGLSDAMKLYCVVRTAKEGGHASCSARDEVAGCNGAEKTYSYELPSIPSNLAENPRVKKFMDHVAREQKKFRRDDKPSKGLVGMSRRGIRNLRSSLGADEKEQSSSPQSGSLPQDTLPELPAQSPASLPFSAAPEPSANSAGLPSESAAPPPEPRSRVRRGARNAGAAVGNFTRNTYRCVRSLFRNCGNEAGEASSH